MKWKVNVIGLLCHNPEQVDMKGFAEPPSLKRCMGNPKANQKWQENSVRVGRRKVIYCMGNHVNGKEIAYF